MIPTFQPRKPFHRRARVTETGAPPTPGVLVTQVLRMDAVTLRWVFNSDVATADANCPQLTANDGSSGLVSPVEIVQSDTNAVDAGYSGVAFPISTTTWQIAALLDGVTFADGPVSYPQSGSVSE